MGGISGVESFPKLFDGLRSRLVLDLRGAYRCRDDGFLSGLHCAAEFGYDGFVSQRGLRGESTSR